MIRPDTSAPVLFEKIGQGIVGRMEKVTYSWQKRTY